LVARLVGIVVSSEPSVVAMVFVHAGTPDVIESSFPSAPAGRISEALFPVPFTKSPAAAHRGSVASDVPSVPLVAT